MELMVARDWRRLVLIGALLLAPLALGGCAVVSDQPLFDPSVAPAHRLATGLWAMSGPGCQVNPNPAGELPGCAAPITITDERMDWDIGAFVARMTGAPTASMGNLPLPKSSNYVLVDGEPAIVELLNGEAIALPTRDGRPRPPLKPSYMAFKVDALDGSGRIVRGIMWSVVCPPPRQSPPPGMARQGAQCLAQTPEAIRAQAKTLPPFLSFFMTWVSATPPPPPEPSVPAPKAP
ncbi:MAG TPA: hypothetical protein VHX64_07695 [Caulobacteraceae bacterium]|nr:hypothetical protein [Caulobacteraceae bacterium]